jgi:hypothetical protein
MKNDEFEAMKSVEASKKYISTPGVHICKILSIENSDNIKGYTGKPYLKIELENQNGEINTTRYYRVTPNDSDNAAKFKHQRLKEFFEASKADFSSASAMIKTAVGKKIQVFFRKEEFIGIDKEQNDKPVIKTKLEVLFVKSIDADIVGNQSWMFKGLTEEMQAKFKSQKDLWEIQNGIPEPSEESNDDPFA